MAFGIKRDEFLADKINHWSGWSPQMSKHYGCKGSDAKVNAFWGVRYLTNEAGLRICVFTFNKARFHQHAWSISVHNAHSATAPYSSGLTAHLAKKFPCHCHAHIINVLSTMPSQHQNDYRTQTRHSHPPPPITCCTLTTAYHLL